MPENYPVLISHKPLKQDFANLQKISITCEEFSVGRGLNNSAIIPFLAISRNHCVFRKLHKDEWHIHDYSSFGIQVNGEKLGKGKSRKLSHDDLVQLEPSEEFVYKFIQPEQNDPDNFETPRKRRRLSSSHSSNIINDVKTKFEQSQCYEQKHIEEKIQNVKQIQTTSIILKEQLKADMHRKLQQLEKGFSSQIENLKGEKMEVERQKTILIQERDAQLAAVKLDMEAQITHLMEQIQRHNETEAELLDENNQLKEKLLKERQEFLSELNRESTSKQDLLDKLEARIREQEEIRMKEKQELEELLRNETEQLRLAKEKELKELEEQKKSRELELKREMNNLKKQLEEQIEQAKEQKAKCEQNLQEQMEQMKKLNAEEKAKLQQLMYEREEIQKQLTIEAQKISEKSIQDLQASVAARETELAALAVDRIEKQSERANEVITSLQDQLEKVRSQLKSVESEKNILLEKNIMCQEEPSTSKQSTLAEVGELIETELQCSICAELFISAITLNCSHTFCKYCITMWKAKKKDCPICRTPITSECRSIVLDSFIEKIVQNLTEEVKAKRQDLLKFREELESDLTRRLNTRPGRPRRSGSYGTTTGDEDDDDDLDDHEEELEEEEEYEYDRWSWRDRGRDYGYTDSGSDNTDYDDSEDSAAFGPAADATAAAAGVPVGGASALISHNTTHRTGGPANSANGGRRRGVVPGRPGSYYGGYGRCFSCGARGHWAPGCPFS